MIGEKEVIKIAEYSERILEIIDRRDQLSRGDLQGAIEAVVMNIMSDVKKELQGKK